MRGAPGNGRSYRDRRFSALIRDWQLVIADLESGKERVALLWHRPDAIGNLAWAPDGKRITISGACAWGGKERHYGLFDVEVSSGKVTPVDVPVTWTGVGTMAWLSDGSAMLASVSDPHQPPQIWLLPRDGSKTPPRKLTSDIAGYNGVSLTGDGKAFVAMRIEMSANLFLVPLDRPANVVPLTSGIGNYIGTNGLHWLSAKELVYTSWSGGTAAINAMAIDRREPREIARGAYWNLEPAPDGRSIGAIANIDQNTWDIMSMDVNGGSPRQITHGAQTDSFTWTPDGKGVVYTSSANLHVAWLQPLAGGTPRQLTTMPVNLARVSPDGTQLLCRMRTTGRGPLWQTAIVPMNGGPTRFFDVPRHGGPPLLKWTADGRGFTFADYAGGVANIWLQPLDGGEPRQLTRFESGLVAMYDPSPDGTSMAVSHGEVLRDLVLIREFR